MFIPRGKLVQDNLATSYVLLDPLVEDLHEGGFSGLVEIVLRESDAYVIFDGGNIVAVLEKHGEAHDRADLAQISARSRLERGRVAIYAYPSGTAALLAARINAQTLYTRLSTRFTDPEKIIAKLARELEREWFIEIIAENGPRALINLREGRCRVISSSEDPRVEESSVDDLPRNLALGQVLFECRRAGGTLDVSLRRPTEDHEIEIQPNISATALPPEVTQAPQSEDSSAHVAELSAEPEATESQFVSVSTIEPVVEMDESAALEEPVVDSTNVAAEERTQEHVDANDDDDGAAVRPDSSSFEIVALLPGEADENDVALESLADELKTLSTGDLVLAHEASAAEDVETMAEVKRLMAEIARTIEEAAQSVGRADGFSMCLRAAQIKLADDYPFLDPFGGEFEYLSGEVVFVGQATVREFVNGFGEALALAVRGVTQSTSYPERFRAYVAEDLRKLLGQNHAEFERLGLDQVIARLVSLQVGTNAEPSRP